MDENAAVARISNVEAQSGPKVSVGNAPKTNSDTQHGDNDSAAVRKRIVICVASFDYPERQNV